MKMQGGIAKNDLTPKNVEAVKAGCVNVERHIQNLKKFGVTPVVSINHFIHDTDEEIAIVKEVCDREGVPMVIARHWAEGGAGAHDLANAVKAELDKPKPTINMMYEDGDKLAVKVEKVAKEIYRADGIMVSASAKSTFRQIEKMGFGHLPICIAKTQSSFSTDAKKLGATSGHTVEVREATLNAGAGFVVAVCGTIMRMPGLPRHPAALDIGLDEDGQIVGLA